MALSKLLSVPKRLASLHFLQESGLLSFGSTANLSSQHEGSSVSKLLINLLLALSLASGRQVSDMHGLATRIVILLHQLDHFVAEIVHLDEGKVDLLGSELAHLILQFVAIWRAIWVSIVAIAHLPAMAWGVSNVEDGLDGVRVPAHAQSLVETSLDIFRHVVASGSGLLRDEGFDCVEIFREVHGAELVFTITEVPVADERDSDLQSRVVSLYLVDDVLECVL